MTPYLSTISGRLSAILLGFAALQSQYRGLAEAATIEMVTVGNPGNAPDTRYNNIAVGSVDYVYRIGKYEVTVGQYTEFLNAVAKSDPNGLYHPVMREVTRIERSGSSPNFSYNVTGDSANWPVNLVSFWDAARFANWLHHGQPTGPQGPGTTEDGAYLNIGNSTTFARQPGAKFYVPDEDEWYKAVYHNKGAGLATSYFDYPTGSNVEPGNDITESTNPGNNANHDVDGDAIGPPHFRTDVGEFELSASPYGTFDQGGNVWEWNETAFPNSARGQRGGSYVWVVDGLHASQFAPTAAGDSDHNWGFRVASPIPEPPSIMLCIVIAFSVGIRSRTIDGPISQARLARTIKPAERQTRRRPV